MPEKRVLTAPPEVPLLAARLAVPALRPLLSEDRSVAVTLARRCPRACCT